MDLVSILKRIEARAAELGTTPNAIGEAVKKPWIVPNIKKAIKSGRKGVALSSISDIAEPLKVTVDWLVNGDDDAPHIDSEAIAAPRQDIRSEDVAAELAASPRAKTVRIKGYVGAGGEAHFYRLADEDYEEVIAPFGATDHTIAVEIKGSSWGPHMTSWLVFYDDVRSPVTEDLIGLPCVVGLADDRILIKVIKRNGNGSYKLLSNNPNEPEIHDAVIEWAARVTSMRPR